MAADGVYFADEGGIAVDMSREASLEMSNTPTGRSTGGGSPGTPNATSLVSLWQTNSVGFRCERTVNWQLRRPGSVQVLTQVEWGQLTRAA
jgi:hypothetical protein